MPGVWEELWEEAPPPGRAKQVSAALCKLALRARTHVREPSRPISPAETAQPLRAAPSRAFQKSAGRIIMVVALSLWLGPFQ